MSLSTERLWPIATKHTAKTAARRRKRICLYFRMGCGFSAGPRTGQRLSVVHLSHAVDLKTGNVLTPGYRRPARGGARFDWRRWHCASLKYMLKSISACDLWASGNRGSRMFATPSFRTQPCVELPLRARSRLSNPLLVSDASEVASAIARRRSQDGTTDADRQNHRTQGLAAMACSVGLLWASVIFRADRATECAHRTRACHSRSPAVAAPAAAAARPVSTPSVFAPRRSRVTAG